MNSDEMRADLEDYLRKHPLNQSQLSEVNKHGFCGFCGIQFRKKWDSRGNLAMETTCQKC